MLNQLLERGLAQNFEIRAARSRWEEARQLAGLASADRGASVGASAKGSYTLAGRMENPLNAQSRAQLAQNPNTAALAAPHFDMNDGNNIQLGLSASWEPDFFGRKSSDEDAARAGAAAAAAQYRGAQLLTAAAIVDGYLQARALQARQRLHEAHLATLKRLQHYVAGRYQAGQTSAYELNDIDSKISALNAKGALLHSDYERQVRALAVLTGRRPTDFQLAEGRADLFTRQPAAPAGALPSSLLERRPDLLAKAALVKARAAQVASAQADFLPRFTLEFSLPFLSINGSSHAQGWASMVNANLQTPLFTNGRLDRQLGAAEARLRTARLDYDQTLLQALADVDNAHQAHRALERQNELLAAAQTAALRQAEDGEAGPGPDADGPLQGPGRRLGRLAGVFLPGEPPRNSRWFPFQPWSSDPFFTTCPTGGGLAQPLRRRRRLFYLEQTMSLISCPDCGGQISRRAQTCPHCGRPLHAQPMLGAAAKGLGQFHCD